MINKRFNLLYKNIFIKIIFNKKTDSMKEKFN